MKVPNIVIMFFSLWLFIETCFPKFVPNFFCTNVIYSFKSTEISAPLLATGVQGSKAQLKAR